MKGEEREGRLDRLLLSSAFWYLLPTPAIFLLNRKRVTTPVQIGALPVSEWSQRERRRLLQASETRLQNIEGKGPGVAAVTAVVAAGVLIALTNGWGEAGLLGKFFLVLGALYSTLSLLTPIYLVGPLKRHVVDVPELEKAASEKDPDEWLAATSAEEAMHNDLQNIRLANHLDAARRELAYAVGFLSCWAILALAGGVLGDHSDPDRGTQVQAPASGIVKPSNQDPKPEAAPSTGEDDQAGT